MKTLFYFLTFICMMNVAHAAEDWVCINNPTPDNYYHYVFTSDLKSGQNIEIKDYAQNYTKFFGHVDLVNQDRITVANPANLFELTIKLNESLGNGCGNSKICVAGVVILYPVKAIIDLTCFQPKIELE